MQVGDLVAFDFYPYNQIGIVVAVDNRWGRAVVHWNTGKGVAGSRRTHRIVALKKV